ncbi:hypothetical protein [Streptomyces sp. NPDC049915]|uniref:hypothetical protein n=1 Tax=Streptomyces sp. NPDC049915 TaxID=3155510 RepID=UPI00342A4B36
MATIADAIRRHHQRQMKGSEQPLPPEAEATREAGKRVQDQLPPHLAAALMQGADWPQMAQQLLALQQAGVDLSVVLPQMGEVAATVHEAELAKAAQSRQAEWEPVLRETLSAGPVREAILTSPQWPQIAETLTKLDERGGDVRQLLAAVAPPAVRVEEAVLTSLAASSATSSREALRTYGPLTVGLDIPRDLDLSSRERAMRQLAISPQEHQRYVRWVQEALPSHGREASLILNSKHWPLLAARMAKMESEGKPVQAHLSRLVNEPWSQRPASGLADRLVGSVNDVLQRPAGEASMTRPPVVAAARAQSATVGPTQAAAKNTASAETGVAAHRQTGTASTRGRTR